MVPRRGLEPPRCYPLVPETSASTNSATWAQAALGIEPDPPCQMNRLPPCRGLYSAGAIGYLPRWPDRSPVSLFAKRERHDRTQSLRHPRHRLWRLRLPRPPRGAGAGQAPLPHPRRGAPARPRRSTCSRSAVSARSTRCRPTCATRSRSRPRRAAPTWSSTWSASCSSAAASASTPSTPRAPRNVAAAAKAHGARLVHVSAIGADENSTSRLCALEGRRRAAGARGHARGDDHAAVDHVRPRGQLLQPVRLAGAHVAGAAAGRRRPHEIPAGLRRRRGAGDRQCGRRSRRAPARPTSSAARRCARSARCSNTSSRPSSAGACWCRCRSSSPSCRRA